MELVDVEVVVLVNDLAGLVRLQTLALSEEMGSKWLKACFACCDIVVLASSR